MDHPLILVTNDDGIDSKGLWCAAEALLPLGEVLVVAPDRQWSGAGRSMPHGVTGRAVPTVRDISGRQVSAWAIDASPAQAVVASLAELAPRRPELVVSGINYGANLGTDIGISGTVGAALEAGAWGIPALAVSLDMDDAYTLRGDPAADYAAAVAFTREIARFLLAFTLPTGVNVLNLNIPAEAVPHTPWRLTHLAHCRHCAPLPASRPNGDQRPRFQRANDPEADEPGSDLRAVLADRVVSVTPLTLDLTSSVDLAPYAFLGAELAASLAPQGMPLSVAASRLQKRKRWPSLLEELSATAGPLRDMDMEDL